MNGGAAPQPRRVVWTVVVFAAALATRLFFVMYGQGYNGDSPQYRAIARHIVEHGTFAIVDGSPTVFRPPGYPFFMAVVYAFFGTSDLTVLLAQAIVGAAACALLYRLLLRLVGAPVAALTAVMTAVHTDLAFYAGRILSETLISAALVAFVYCVYRANLARDPRVRRRFAAASGITAACVVLVHPRFMGAPLIGMAALWLARRDRGEQRRAIALCGVTALVVLAPWTVRNYLEFGLPNPTGLCDPSRVLLLGAKQVPPNDYRYLALFRTDPLLRRYDEFISDSAHEQARFQERLALERELATAAVHLIESRPGSFLLSVVRGHPQLWISRDAYIFPFLTPPFAFANQQMTVVQLVKSGRLIAALLRTIAWAKDLAVPLVLVPIGMVMLMGRWRDHAVLYLLVAWVALLQAPLWIEYRFTVPLHPILAIFAAHALDRITARTTA